MAARVAEARDRGLRLASAETWAEHAEHSNPSQHNMVRAGLTEVHRRPNWVWRAQAPPSRGEPGQSDRSAHLHHTVDSGAAGRE